MHEVKGKPPGREMILRKEAAGKEGVERGYSKINMAPDAVFALENRVWLGGVEVGWGGVGPTVFEGNLLGWSSSWQEFSQMFNQAMN